MSFQRKLQGLWKGNSRGQLIRLAAQLPTYVKLLWGLSKDRRVPIHAKGMLVAALAYLASPIDLIPDFIPVIGQMDDVVVFLLVWKVFRSQCPPEVWEEHLQRVQMGESDFDRDLAWIKENASGLVEYVSRNLERLLGRSEKGAGGRR